MSQPDRDEPRRFRIGRDLQTGALIAYQVSGPRLQAEDITEVVDIKQVVESREPFPSDEALFTDLIADLRGLDPQIEGGWTADEIADHIEQNFTRRFRGAVSSHRELPRKENRMERMPCTYVYVAQLQEASKAIIEALDAASDQRCDGKAAAEAVAHARRRIENVYTLYEDGATS